jgi:hypothetical protein
MRRSLDLDNGVRDGETATGELLLELRLEVDVALDRVLDPLGERLDDRRLDPLEPELDVESAEARLDESGDDVGVLGEGLDLGRVVSPRELSKPLAEPELPADDRAALARDDVGTDLRQLSLRVLGKALVELLGDREPEDAVPEKLQPLVGLGAVFRPRGVRERVAQPLVGQRVDQLRERPATA